MNMTMRTRVAPVVYATILLIPTASFGQDEASFVKTEHDRMICKGTPFVADNTITVVEGGRPAPICIKYTAKNWPINENWSISQMDSDIVNGTKNLELVRTPLRYTVSVEGNSKGWWVDPPPSTEAQTRGWDTIRLGDEPNTATYTEIIEIRVGARNNSCKDPVNDQVTIRVSFKHERTGGGDLYDYDGRILTIIAQRKDDEDGPMAPPCAVIYENPPASNVMD